MHVDAIILAAGASTRFGEADKLYAPLGGRPVLAWSLAAFESVGEISRIVVVTAAERSGTVEELARQWCPSKMVAVVAGGVRRRDSAEAGLRAATTGLAAIHDGARPLVTAALVERCLAAATAGQAAVPLVAVSDSIKEVDRDRVSAHLDRSRLRAAQTPQVVPRQAWLRAAALSEEDETDDVAMVARVGVPAVAVEGDPENIKLTRPADLELAEALLRARAARAAS
jgi:2-C-methyl-D-erythritol 4-phosphate cytidylyltransferase